MKNYDIAPTAHRDMREIFNYIAIDNPSAANRMLDAFFEAIEMLAEHPKAGNIKSKFTHLALRFWPVKSRYLIVYRESEPIEIVHILNTYRNISALIN